MEDNIRLSIIDDNHHFRTVAYERLQGIFTVQCLDSASDSAKELAHVVSNFKPDHVLLDANLHQTKACQQILEALSQQQVLSRRCKIWIISQGAEEDILQRIPDLQKKNALVQDKPIRKPLDNPNRLRATLTSQIGYEPTPPYDQSFPLPLRIINSDGKVVFTNRFWAHSEISFDHDWAEKDVVKPYRAGFESYGDPFYGEGVAYRLHRTFFSQGDHLYKAQIAEVSRDFHLPDTQSEAVKMIMKIMKEVGFKQGRYYMIRSLVSNGQKEDEPEKSLVLEKNSDDNDLIIDGKVIKMPVRRPLEKKLLERINYYLSLENSCDNNNLHYTIREAKEDEDDNDSGINWWNSLLNIQLKNWLELPVLMTNDNIMAESNYPIDIKGVFIFDRKSDEMTDDRINKGQIESLNGLLRSLITFYQSSLRNHNARRLREYECTMMKMDNSLFEIRDDRPRFDKILETACLVSKAKSALMVIPNAEGSRLKVVSAYGSEILLNMVDKVEFSTKAISHPIVRAWNVGKLVVRQNFEESIEYSRLLEQLTDSNEKKRNSTHYEHLNHLTNEGKKIFLDWLIEDVKAVLAMPISLGKGSKPIGFISLQFEEPWTISCSRKRRIDTVLQRARWVIQEYSAKQERNAWLQTIAHEIKSDLSICLNHTQRINRSNIVTAKEEIDWRMLQRYLNAANDLTSNWMTFVGAPSQKPVLAVNPKESIMDFLEINRLRIEEEGVKLKLTPSSFDKPCWQKSIAADSDVFARVIRILLDNALKFGSIDKEEHHPVEIVLSAHVFIKKHIQYWKLSIQNPGRMSEEEYRYRFMSGVVPSNRVTDGSHVGLGVARKLVHLYDGELHLENSQNVKKVEAILLWPVFQES